MIDTCPFCNHPPIVDDDGTIYCGHESCGISGIGMDVYQWQRRSHNLRLAKLENVINTLRPVTKTVRWEEFYPSEVPKLLHSEDGHYVRCGIGRLIDDL